MADERHQSRLMDGAAEVIERLVFERRSIRRYKSDPLPEAWIEAMLACAHQAPSPTNSQPVRFVRIRSDGCRENLRQALVRGHEQLLARHKAAGAPARLRNWINAYRRYAEFMFEAPELLTVGVDPGVAGFARRLRHAGLWAGQQDTDEEMTMTVGLALNSLLLKAQALGIGSCVLTAPLIFIRDVEKLLGVKDLAVKCFVTLGLADETPKAAERRPLAQVVTVV